MGLGTGAADKQVKAWTLSQVYGVNSLEMVERKNIKALRDGLEVVRGFSDRYKVYLNECLDKEESPEKTKVQQMMKELIAEPVK